MIHALVVAIRNLATSHPTAVYEPPSGSRCFYTLGVVRCNDGSTLENNGCIVGQAIRLVYPNKVQALDQNDLSDYEHDGTNSTELLRNLCIDDVPEGQIRWIEIVQDKQDSGKYWNVAVDWADRLVGVGG